MRMIPERRQIVHLWQNWDNYSVEELPGLPRIFRLSHYRIGSCHASPEDEHTVKRPISMGIFAVSEKELFRSLILSFPFEIDYTTIDSRRSS